MLENQELPGVIFDVDGVLLDSNPAHLESWQIMGRRHGVNFTPELFQETVGQTTRAILAHHWPYPLTEEQIEAFDREKEDIYLETASRKLPAMPGAYDFVRQLYDAGFPLSVGSSGPRKNVLFVMEKLGVLPYLAGIVTGTDVVRGKPAPDIFLACAEKMNQEPENCVVIDDSASGIAAARAGGMKIVGFFSQGHQEDEYRDADFVIRAFDELSSKRLIELFKK